LGRPTVIPLGVGNVVLRVRDTQCYPNLHAALERTFCFALGLTSELLATILRAYWVLLCSEVPKKHLANPPWKVFGRKTG